MPKYEHAFTLYRHDVEQLIAHLQKALEGQGSASFDVSEDGYVRVYVAGSEPLNL
jgi:hypothetical protein